MTKTVTIGVPKGSLQESTLALFKRAGFSFSGSDRSLWLSSDDPEIRPVLLRAQEIPRYVANGSLDGGLSGLDWITETDCNDDIRILAELCYSKASFRPIRWVLAVADDSEFKTVDDLRRSSGNPVRISTELKRTTENWLAKRGIVAEVDFSWGATEAKVPAFADAVVECTETGTSLRANRLRILETVFESKTQFFANKEIYKKDDWKRAKLGGIALMLKSCIAAENKVCIHAHAPRSEVKILKALIPSDASFSIWNGSSDDMLIEIVSDKQRSRSLVPVLARNGANRIFILNPELLYD